MKRVLAVLIALSMLLCMGFAGCSKTQTETTTGGTDESTTAAENTAFDYDAVPDTMTSTDGKYVLAFVTDVGQLKDKSFNQGTWEGIKKYASENSKSYKYYQPANGEQATDDDRYNAMKAAADAGAEVIVCAGFLQGTALIKAASEFTSVKFVFIDSGSVIEDADGNVLKNVASINFKEEQSGYLAGYAAVMEGYTKLGFTGGGGGTNPACCRFGYGYVQGAEAAATAKDVKVTMNYSWLYGASFSASPDLQTMLNGWYTNGTEVIFACGGSMFSSAATAASENDAKLIGVDVDQSFESDTVITSATKGLHESVILALEKNYSDKWDDLGGKITTLGAAEDAVGLPTATWSLKNFSVEDYGKVLDTLKDGTLKVDNDYANLATATFTHLTLNVVE